MGSGNPKLKSFDNDRFEPVTYFIDLSVEPEIGEDGNEDYIEASIQEDENYEDMIALLSEELDLEFLGRNTKSSYSELSCGFRNAGIILLQGDYCYVITESAFEYNHIPFAIIPNFRFDHIMLDNNSDEKAAEKEWKNLFAKFLKEEARILKFIKSAYKKNMSIRNGSWTSSPVA